MLPVGLEFIAPILIDLSGEINKINSILPNILDIKSAVINTADTVRDFKKDLTNLHPILQLNNSSIKVRNNVTPTQF